MRRTNRKTRQRRWPSLVVGLTGSVAMGKSTASALLKSLGIPVFDADRAVHGLLGPKGKALKAVAKRFPGVVGKRGADRKKLGAKVFADKKAFKNLEAILHPLVREQREEFLKRAALDRRPLVVLDIPLLFEGKTERLCDLVIVVSAPGFLQRQRALARPGMTAARFQSILARQWPDQRKRRAADVVIPSGLGKRETLRRLKQLLTVLSVRSRGL
jgi:dephospho-CoA kinase